MMPEPQTPVTPVLAAASAKPGSSDQMSQPMTLKRGSSVSGRCAPARWRRARRAGRRRSARPRRPARSARSRPAAAGGCRARSRRWCRHRRSASSRRRSVALPTARRRRCRRRHGRRCRAARRRGRSDGCADRSPTPRYSPAPSMASAKGAPPSSVGSRPSSRWCMIGLPTKVTSRMSRTSDAGFRGDAGGQPVHARRAPTRVISASPPGFIMT